MSDFKDDLLTELLGCGYADLSVLEDCQYDMYDVIEYCKDACLDLTLNNLAWSMFQIGRADIMRAIEERIDELESQEELSDDEQEELDALDGLDPYEDIKSFHNYLDTSVWFSKNGDVYRQYIKEAIEEFGDNTGYSIGD